MSINQYTYRTKTYIAGDWTGDKDAIDKLYQWNNSDYWRLNFTDVHELTQSRDSSLNCSIKASLRGRMNISKTFVLIVGDHTKALRSGACYFCGSCKFSIINGYYCTKGYFIDNRSYVDFECDLAISAGIKIVVLYNSALVDKSKCPEVLRDIGIHIPMKKFNLQTLRYEWNYQAVKQAVQH